MRILVDECIDRRFAQELTGHEAATVFDKGWAGISNGELLRLAENAFDVFLTVDRNAFQQPLPQFNIAVVVMRARTNRLRDLLPLAARVLEALPSAARGRVTWVE